MSPIPAGSIVLVDFEAWTDDGELFDTTRPAVAEKAGLKSEDIRGPIPVIVGAGRVLPGFDEALQAAEPGAPGEVTVAPAKGFGARQDALVRTFPMAEFLKREIAPEPGMRVEMQNRRGTITQVTASRVKVDFNHPYAGRALTYKFTVDKVLDDVEAKVRALIDLAFKPGASDDFSVKIDGKTLSVTPPESLAMDPAWFLAKHRLAHDVFDHVAVDTLVLEERVSRKAMEAHGHHGHEHGGAEEE